LIEAARLKVVKVEETCEDIVKTRVPLVLVGVLYLVLFAALLGTFERLPDRVASHFNGAGAPDGWMTRTDYLAFTTGLAIFLPGLVVGLCFALRFMPAWTFNLPNRDYWLAPERRAETFAYFFRHSLWFACLAILFVIGIHLTVVEANNNLPSRLSLPLLLLTAGGFLIGMVVWILKLLWPFLKNRSDTEGTEELHRVHRGGL
jgi:uncharacterized membrane protein